jgi:hypothetical protein
MDWWEVFTTGLPVDVSLKKFSLNYELYGQSQRASRYSIAATVIYMGHLFRFGCIKGTKPTKPTRVDQRNWEMMMNQWMLGYHILGQTHTSGMFIGLNCVFGNLGVGTGESPNMLGYGIYLWFLERGFRLRAESGFILRLGFCHSVQYNWGLHPATLNTAYGLCGNPATSIVEILILHR